MAIGLARLFGIILPLNFFSPYKANNIIDFWRRWHMTLSRFLRDYLYIPLGGNRKGSVRRYFNLFVTMLLGGLWHGAGWTFVLWGALHGIYLMINHAWRWLVQKAHLKSYNNSFLGSIIARAVTFIAVVVGWVFFRSTSMQGALSMVHGLFGMNGISWPAQEASQLGSLTHWFVSMGGRIENLSYFTGSKDLVMTVVMLTIVWAAPNTTQIMHGHNPALNAEKLLTGHRGIRWRPTYSWLVLMTIIATACILNLAQVSEFLYFQF